MSYKKTVGMAIACVGFGPWGCNALSGSVAPTLGEPSGGAGASGSSGESSAAGGFGGGLVGGAGGMGDTVPCDSKEGLGECCQPGEVVPCYTGPDGSDGIGNCHGGTQTCGDDGNFGPCEGERIPAEEQCGDPDPGACWASCEAQQVLAVDLANTHACAILNDGSVKCWGNKLYLGIGSEIDNRGDEAGEMGGFLPAVDLGPGRIVAQLAAGAQHMCARFNDGSVKCWGENGSGQLGLGSTLDRGLDLDNMGDALPEVDLGIGKKAVAIAAGGHHTCALLDGGDVKCWGLNSAGQLGLGNKLARGDGLFEMGEDLPVVDLGPGLKAAAISAGGDHTCALLTDGRLKCWGGNAHGQLGIGSTVAKGDGLGEMGANLPFVDLGSGKTAKAVSAGYFYTCAILNEDSVKCWGANDDGQLGQDNHVQLGDQTSEMGDKLPPVDLGTGNTAVAISTSSGDGSYHHTCAILANGSLKCWGANNKGQLGLDLKGGYDADMGDGDDPNGEMGDNLPIVDLGTGRTAVQVAVGCAASPAGGYTCAVLDDGTLKCWGLNGFGRLGLELPPATVLGDEPNFPHEMGDNLPAVKLYSGQQ